MVFLWLRFFHREIPTYPLARHMLVPRRRFPFVVFDDGRDNADRFKLPHFRLILNRNDKPLERRGLALRQTTETFPGCSMPWIR